MKAANRATITVARSCFYWGLTQQPRQAVFHYILSKSFVKIRYSSDCMFRIEEQEKRCQSKAVDDSKGSPDRGTCRKDILSCKTVSKEGKSVSHVAVIRPSVCKPQSARQEAIIPLKDILLLSIWLPVISNLPLRIRCDTWSWTEW